MLIQNTKRQKLNVKKLVLFILSIAAITAIGYFICYPLYLKLNTSKNPDIILCDAERTSSNKFISNGQQFSGAKSQSSEYAYQGKFSSKLKEADQNQFGFGYEFKNLKPGDIFETSVWVKNEGDAKAFLVFAGSEKSGFYEANDQLGEAENGFHQISMVVQVPNYFSEKSAKVYVYSDGKNPVFFDDLSIKQLDQLPDSLSTVDFNPSRLEIELKSNAYNKLKNKIETAFKKGVLITDEDSWVNGKLIDQNEKISVKLRLKGDWLDHVKGDKWSFRVKARNSATWNRMVTFSLQTPAARYYALEWLLHQFWEREDILTTRYDFIHLSVNGKNLGTYAYEEHFEKQLLEYRYRREGPIVRFSENALWDVRSRSIQLGLGDPDNPMEEGKISSADIAPFKAGKTAKSERLRQQYEIAQNLLAQYQKGLKSAEEIFDINQLAKYHATVDIFGAYHGIVWHNQRYYYNPVTSLLEPIGFDGFGNEPRRDPLVLGKALLENGEAHNNGPLRTLFENEAFLEKYMFYLDQYSQESFLQDFFQEIKPGMNARVDFLKKEFPQFKYNPKRILNRAKQIRFRLLPYHEHSIRAHWTSDTQDETLLTIMNSHELPLKVIGTGTNNKEMNFEFEKQVNMPAFRMGNPRKDRLIKAPEDAKYVFYQPYGIDTIFSSQIDLFSAVSNQVPRQALLIQSPLKSNDIFDINDKIIIFKKGQHQSKNDILIPAGYDVIFEAGFQMDLIKKAKFISYSKIQMLGTNEQPISIYSSDKSANGFTILQSPGTSSLSYVNFTDLNTLLFNGWNLTGAVSFYESDVVLDNVRIKDNHCEDALNIIRSEFNINELELINPAFDGFDADFCQGRLYNSVIKNPGNDGIDFSGSNIEVIGVKIYSAGDKGISVGEESKVTVESTLVDGAVIGAASKDLSYLRVKSLDLKNCNQGFAAYQKKPEYGRSTIYVEWHSAENVKYLHTIAPRCTLELKGQVIVGEEVKVE